MRPFFRRQPPALALLVMPGLLSSATAATCGGTSGPTAQDLLGITSTCDPLPGVSAFATDSGGSASVRMCALDGAIWFKADFDVDCDGGSESACLADPYYQPETSASDSNGDPLDASNLPFTVLPLDSNGFTLSGQDLRLGSVGAVIYGDRLYYGPLGDRGPKGVVGEGSYAMAERLGIPPSPISGGVSSGVTWIIFTGSDAVVSPIEDEAAAQAEGAAQATELLADN